MVAKLFCQLDCKHRINPSGDRDTHPIRRNVIEHPVCIRLPVDIQPPLQICPMTTSLARPVRLRCKQRIRRRDEWDANRPSDVELLLVRDGSGT